MLAAGRPRSELAASVTLVPVQLRVWLFEDSGLAVEGGGFDMYYAGWDYELIVDGRVYGLRRYQDEADEVAFHGTSRAPTPEGSDSHPPDEGIQAGVPYDDPRFVKAALWLLDQPGIERLTVFTSDPPKYPEQSYVPVDPARLNAAGPALKATDETLETSEPLQSELDAFLGYDAQPLTSRRWRRPRIARS